MQIFLQRIPYLFSRYQLLHQLSLSCHPKQSILTAESAERGRSRWWHILTLSHRQMVSLHEADML